MRSLVKQLTAINSFTLTVLTTLLVTVLFLSANPLLNLIELKTYDLRFMSRGALSPSPAVVLALIDEKSLDTQGRWPWPRSILAELVDRLASDGAKVIGFDIGFLEPDANARLEFIDRLDNRVAALQIDNPALSAFIADNRYLADNDAQLAAAIANVSDRVVLGYFFHMNAAGPGCRISPAEINRQLACIRTAKYPLVIYEDPAMAHLPFPAAYAPESNLAIFSEAAGNAGFFSIASDPDGVVRWAPLMIRCGHDLFRHLAVSCAWHYLDRPQLMVQVARYGVQGIRMGDRFIPTNESGQLLINYLGPPKTFPHFSISDILAERIPRWTFRDKIVLVGATAMGTHDMRSTPLSPVYPGVEIHATIIDNLLTRRFMTRPAWSRVLDLLAIVLLSASAGFILPRMGAVKGLGVALGLACLYLFIAHWLFVSARIWLNIVYPLTALLATYTGLTVYQYFTEERERRKIKGTFRQYVAPLVIEEMLKEPKQLQLGGEEKVLTVLFSDLEGFTGYSERYAPREMITILSEYFNHMTEQVFAHRGTLKEYVGDELMAIFGAPIEKKDHAQRACSTALAMRDRLRTLRPEWVRLGRPPLRARTGINSGPMLVGNLGSRYRFAYGVLGDQVNLGSRLEGLNKMYKTEILIGENTAELLDEKFRLRKVDLVRVVGKQQCVKVYELVARSDTPLPPEHAGALTAYAAGYDDYCRQRWAAAIEHFQRALALMPDDGPSRTMLSRCRIYLETPPPDDWECVFEPETK